jgi:16S rRNA (uracil1498-N3)-methyltransferase
MSLPYFFAPSITPQKTGNLFLLEEDTSRHIVQVLRMEEGAPIRLTDGLGLMATASITSAHKKKCEVRIETLTQTTAKTKQVSIAISLIKNNSRFEWFLEKATEIGVTEIIPLICKRTEKQHFRYERMQGILIAAMLQSQQTFLPVLHEPADFTKLLTEADEATRFIAYCDERDRPSLKEIVAGGDIISNARLLIGPEGDFTPEEIDAALNSGYQPVSLGVNRLRTETAGVVGATLLALV